MGTAKVTGMATGIVVGNTRNNNGASSSDSDDEGRAPVDAGGGMPPRPDGSSSHASHASHASQRRPHQARGHPARGHQAGHQSGGGQGRVQVHNRDALMSADEQRPRPGSAPVRRPETSVGRSAHAGRGGGRPSVPLSAAASSSSSSSASSSPGGRLADYDLLSELGRGAHGVVWRSRSRKNKRTYAIKEVILRRLGRKDRKRVLVESKLLRSLHHPHIVKYFASFIQRGTAHLVMEYAPGGDLHALIKRQVARSRDRRYLKEDVVWRYFWEISSALRYLHGRRIMHRDLKTLNIFLTRDNHIKVGDLGVSRLMVDEGELMHSRVGTPLYLAPELIKKEPYGLAADIWSLGCVVYSLMALQPPFQGTNIYNLACSIVRDRPPSLPNMYTRNLRGTTLRLLEKNTVDRPTIAQSIEMFPESVRRRLNLVDDLPLPSEVDTTVEPPPQQRGVAPEGQASVAVAPQEVKVTSYMARQQAASQSVATGATEAAKRSARPPLPPRLVLASKRNTNTNDGDMSSSDDGASPPAPALPAAPAISVDRGVSAATASVVGTAGTVGTEDRAGTVGTVATAAARAAPTSTTYTASMKNHSNEHGVADPMGAPTGGSSRSKIQSRPFGRTPQDQLAPRCAWSVATLRNMVRGKTCKWPYSAACKWLAGAGSWLRHVPLWFVH